ncbi:F-box only protein 9 [Sitodiplosis mosellana]|uniref:F-box only protein 9 n=1 Tax=Sitodiplosis mosellana TaxID=263140 RepID=UPI002444931C|nr:F-box only protein 9 [Sitodiplosis mosellana]XP_055325138.1 F-box only protein 9 [Sitodiplosis mosellana]
MDMDDDSDGSLSAPPETLDQFREKWQQELNTTKRIKQNKVIQQKTTSCEEPNNSNDQAELLFMQGDALERKGKVFEAMRMYRRAVHIDPDIEFKMYDKLKANIYTATVKPDTRKESAANDDNEYIEDLSCVDLVHRFETSIVNGNGNLFNRDTAEGVIVTDGLHISSLPTEIILYILRWVVSSNLDMRSLEQCSMVCKGFYLIARDMEIWRLACFKVWGHGVGILKGSKYSSWRQMYIERPRAWFNGCYISKTSYLRYGERSFQDQFYRPVHLVEYYRYIRFFPDGTVLVVTSTDEPSHMVGKLQLGHNRHDVLKGNYKFSNDMVTIIVRKNKTKDHGHEDRYRGFMDYEKEPPTFCLQLLMSYTKKRRLPQLEWKKYSIIQRQNKYEELCTDFDLTPNIYPALIFSRVKSYDSVSYHHL